VKRNGKNDNWCGVLTGLGIARRDAVEYEESRVHAACRRQPLLRFIPQVIKVYIIHFGKKTTLTLENFYFSVKI